MSSSLMHQPLPHKNAFNSISVREDSVKVITLVDVTDLHTNVYLMNLKNLFMQMIHGDFYKIYCMKNFLLETISAM